MTILVHLVSVGLLLVLGLDNLSYATPTQCNSLAADELILQRSLYEYAQVADIASTRLPQWRLEREHGLRHDCRVGDTNEQVGLTVSQIVELPSQLLTELREQRDLVHERFEIYEGNDGRTYLACRSESGVSLSITLTEFLIRPALYIYFDIKFIAPRRVLRGEIEEVGFVELSRLHGDNESGGERLIAFKSTDFNRIPEFMSSANDLLDPSESCVFDIAAGVVRDIADRFDGRRYYRDDRYYEVIKLGVVGHSLGGAAAQYVAMNSDAYMERLNSNDDNNGVAFNTYSFNSVGLREDSGNLDIPTHYSYYIDGEVVTQWARRLFRRTQPGHTIRYVPPETWPETDMINIIDDVIHSRTTEPFRRHLLTTVQEALCQCINGLGLVDRIAVNR